METIKVQIVLELEVGASSTDEVLGTDREEFAELVIDGC